MALTDKQQGLLMLAVFILPVFIAWLGNGSPTDKAALSLLGASLLSGILAFIKETLGTVPAKTA